MMRTRNRARLASRSLAATGVAVAAFAVVVVAMAQSASGWDLSQRAISGGGGRSSTLNMSLEGSIGQPLAGRSSAGPYVVTSGILEGGPVKYTQRIPAVANDGLSPN